MMKRLGLITLLVLAINFLAVAGGVGYLASSGALTSEKARAIGKLLFPDPPPPASQPALARDPAATQPLLKFDAVLNRQTGKTAAEQVAFLRETFDAMSAGMDRQQREVLDLRRQVDAAQTQLAADRAALLAREQALADRETRQRALDNDAGFQKSLDVYNAMDTKQIKSIFMSLDDATVVRYLQAMEPRRVSRIVKEFTSPAELNRAQSLLEEMRRNDASPEAKPASSPGSSAATPKTPASP